MIMKNKKILIPLSILVLALIGLILGSFFDKSISENIGKPESFIAIFNTAFGDVPILILGVFAGSFVLYSNIGKNKTWKIIIKIRKILSIIYIVALSLFAYSAGSEYATMTPLNEKETLYKILMALIFTLLVATTMILAFVFYKKFDEDFLIKTSLLIVLIIILTAGSGEVIKHLACRPRPRVVMEEIEQFRNWYSFKPFYCFDHEDCKSFVSGHSVNAACTITVLPLFCSLFTFGKTKKGWGLLSVIGILFTIIVALSRMVANAHYLSDVSGGVILSLTIQILVLVFGPKFIELVKATIL